MELSFYIVAHQDDWQALMNPYPAEDLGNPENKVVFIHTTAGDSGKEKKYWEAREQGVISSILFRINPSSPLPPLSTGITARTIGNHAMGYWKGKKPTSASIACYFMRLPSGNLKGEGYPAYGNQGIEKLQKGQINSITTVDFTEANRELKTYNGWEDFCDTTRAIVLKEVEGAGGFSGKIQINTHETDIQINPGDHSDHIVTGLAVQEVLKTIPHRQNYSCKLFVGYSLIDRPAGDLTGPGLFWKVGMFAAYEQTVYNLVHYSTLNENERNFIRGIMHQPEYRIAFGDQGTFLKKGPLDLPKIFVRGFCYLYKKFYGGPGPAARGAYKGFLEKSPP